MKTKLARLCSSIDHSRSFILISQGSISPEASPFFTVLHKWDSISGSIRDPWGNLPHNCSYELFYQQLSDYSGYALTSLYTIGLTLEQQRGVNVLLSGRIEQNLVWSLWRVTVFRIETWSKGKKNRKKDCSAGEYNNTKLIPAFSTGKQNCWNKRYIFLITGQQDSPHCEWMWKMGMQEKKSEFLNYQKKPKIM